MRKLIKIVTVLISLAMIASLFSACQSKENVSSGEKYTYWVSLPGAASQTITSYNDLLMYKEMSKKTGIDVEFMHPASGSGGSEAFQILLSGGDYPDMIEYSWKTYAGGPGQAISDGVIISLNKYMEEYAPNYYDYMEGEKGKKNGFLYKAQSVSDDGNYYGFKNLNIGTYRGFGGLYIRKDKLDEWGLNVPVTIDDWTLVLKTAKDNGFTAPLTGTKALFTITSTEAFNTAWGIGKSWYVDNNKVKYGPFQSAYKEYISKMAEWMKAGYIDKDYVTNDSTNVEGFMTNGNSIAAYGYVGSGIGKILPAMSQKDPNYNLAACPFPVLKDGDIPILQEIQGEANDPCIAISVQCGQDDETRYKEAIKWCDYLYSDEGMILKSFGVEGETYKVEAGDDDEKHYIYTDVIIDHESIGAHSVEAALWHFFRPSNSPGLNQHPDYLNGYYPYEQQKEAIVVWNTYAEEAKKHIFPIVSYTNDEASQMANIETLCIDDLDAAVSNIILGKASIDAYDAAVNKAKEKGFDKLVKIQQNAYERYMSVIK